MISTADLSLTLLLTAWISTASCLDCIQCDRRGAWYSPEENERHIARCHNGLISPTRCANASHTHCIYSYYRTGASTTVTVTERRCGVEDDVIGCTLYKSSSRRLRRHFISGSGTDTPMPSTSLHRRRDAALFVEVCTEGCREDGCINSSQVATAQRLSLLLSALFYLSQYVRSSR